MAVVPRGASLLTLEDWGRALDTAKLRNPSLGPAETVLSRLEVLAKGSPASADAASLFLRDRSLQIWEAATRSAPVDAIELSLRNTRLAAETDATDSIAWCTARELAAAPRPYVRLLGLTNRGWPRRTASDPILPSHIVRARELDPDPASQADRRHFEVILGAATGQAVLSRSRRGAQGSRVGRSPLLQNRPETALSRARIPEHAFSDADRLAARPDEAREVGLIASAGRCWRDWHEENLTAHDGRFEPGNAVIKWAIGRVQSATSLQRLLRDPLGFVWRYALRFDAPRERANPLTIAPDELGKLVHELLRRAVDSLEPDPGYASASDVQIENALKDAADAVHRSWPLEQPVPPRLLWANTVEYASAMALAGLLRKEIAEATTRSWTEVPFGQPEDFRTDRDLPWDPTIPVLIPGTPIRLCGSIDRLDLRKNPVAARVTDYKTGNPPKNPERVVIGGGTELQRCLYGLACRQLLEDEPRVIARLLYLAGDPFAVKLDDLDAALEQVTGFVNEAVATLERGTAVPGRLSFDSTNDLRLALPASPSYERRKRTVFGKAANDLSRFWSYP
ncbi:PD-(D/E)XK nuclease family protein [Bradyrhizobium sp. CB82]|nr:PD-(D/E)XK nuclease family protein [Bradyrhizobium sp. CB82]WFU44987.1 PD-(D/E)XK nuclease family protein [Bradyrhizobium sp. CB82]